jgi:hypothetical protein
VDVRCIAYNKNPNNNMCALSLLQIRRQRGACHVVRRYLPCVPSVHPVAQDVQAVLEVAPDLEYIFGAVHTIQVPDTPYVPAGQGVAVALVDPGGQKNPVTLHAPLQEEVVRPAVAPKKPATQGAHQGDAASLYFPAGQMEVVALVDPARQAYPAVHAPAHADEFIAVVLPYRPPGHAQHTPTAASL